MAWASRALACCVWLGLAGNPAARADGNAPPGDDQAVRAVVAGHVVPDPGITTRIKELLAIDDLLAGVKAFATADGVVTLTGHVRDDDVRARAVEIASSVDGVRRVDDHLRLKRSPK